MIRIAIAGGGTGGHVEPVLAVINSLKEKAQIELLWLGAANSREEFAANEAGIDFVPISVGKLRRYASWNNLRDPFLAIGGMFQALKTLYNFKPQVVFSKSGYVALPTIFAAGLLRIPVVSHESDTALGFSNKLGFRFVSKLCTGFPIGLYPKSIAEKAVFCGNPVVWDRVDKSTRNVSLRKFGFKDNLPIIVVLGGSQGSSAINRHVWETLSGLIDQFQVIHQTGASQLSEALAIKKSLPASLKKHYYCDGFLDRPTLASALDLARLVISRSGANTLADLSYFAIPAILIPLPSAAQNHQVTNAQFISDAGGAIVLPEIGLTGTTLKNLIDRLIFDSKNLEEMGENMANINPKNASKKIASIILEVAK